MVDAVCCWRAWGRDIFQHTTTVTQHDSSRSLHIGNSRSSRWWALGCWTLRWFCQLARLLLLWGTVVPIFGEAGESWARAWMHIQIHRVSRLPAPPPLREKQRKNRNGEEMPARRALGASLNCRQACLRRSSRFGTTRVVGSPRVSEQQRRLRDAHSRPGSSPVRNGLLFCK